MTSQQNKWGMNFLESLSHSKGMNFLESLSHSRKDPTSVKYGDATQSENIKDGQQGREKFMIAQKK